MKTKDGEEFVSDYLFGTIIHDMKIKDSNLKLQLVSMHFDSSPTIDDIKLHSLIEYSNSLIFLKSVLLSIFVNFRWKTYKHKIKDFFKKNELDYLFSSFDQFFTIKSLFYTYLYDYSLQTVLDKHKPKLVMVNNDVMSLRPKVNIENLKFAFLQSASMDTDKESFKMMFIDLFSLNESVADFFLAAGTKFKKIVQDFKVSKEIIIVGQPRYDILHTVDKIYSKDIFFKKYNIDQSKKIILWTTQCHGIDLNENIKNFNVIFNTISGMNNVILLIKQHPAEGDEYDKLIKEFINFYSLNVILLPKISDTYEQIFCSNLVITKDSTTGMEAIALDKPLLILNLSGNPDRMDYVNKGVALGVYSENNLLPSIKLLLKNDHHLAKNRTSFLLENIYKNDGKSTERTIKFIEKIINKG
jgi:hypothetical protein